MELYSSDNNYKLYYGNMLDLSEVIEPNSIDAIVTDPPYELNFMNKGWDNSGIAFQKETWKKCYNALKSGGHMLVFGGSRTFHRIACAIEDAGFEIRDTIMWIYGSGFPKSMDISKQIDKKPNKTYDSKIKFGELIKHYRNQNNLTQRQLGELIGVSRELVNLYEIKGNSQQQIPTKEQWLKIKEVLKIPNDMNYIFEKAEREIVGIKKGSGCWNNEEHYTVGGTKAKNVDITTPATDLAKQWDGWGTQLKPSYEPIIVCRKPCEGSIVDNVMKYGVGGINIDECRVPLENGDVKTKGGCKTREDDISHLKFRANQVGKEDNSCGRFPANTILTYDESDFDEVCSGFPITKSTGGSGIASKKNTLGNIYRGGWGEKERSHLGGLNDEGSASRYFYCAKASKRDRNEGLSSNNRNIHPTIKPTSLMQYLVRLVTPKGGTILDPFNGSGSTGKACMYENADRNANYKYIGIELTEEYLPISKARIEFAEKNPIMDYEIKRTKVSEDKADEVKSKDIFDL